jgi:hypothetical protein
MKSKKEILAVLEKLDPEQQITWMLDLGAELTVAARVAYRPDIGQDSVEQLQGFNEMQHRVYGRIRHLRDRQEWTLESFLDGLLEKATFYGILGDFGWAFRWAMDRLERRLNLNSPASPLE